MRARFSPIRWGLPREREPFTECRPGLRWAQPSWVTPGLSPDGAIEPSTWDVTGILRGTEAMSRGRLAAPFG